MPREYTTIPLPERFWARVAFTDGCWYWLGTATNGGYGHFSYDLSGSVLAHRWAYEFCVGPIPEGCQIDHLCHQEGGCLVSYCIHRRCVNPDHLEPVTAAENTRRSEAISTINARKTHCKRGHEYTEENTYRRPGKHSRDCKACKRAAIARFRERHASVQSLR